MLISPFYSPIAVSRDTGTPSGAQKGGKRMAIAEQVIAKA